MTPEQHREAGSLISAHNSLRWNLARNERGDVGMYLHDDDQNTSHVRLPKRIGRQTMLLSLALITERLRELGIEPEEGFKTDCFEAGCDGKVPMK